MKRALRTSCALGWWSSWLWLAGCGAAGAGGGAGTTAADSRPARPFAFGAIRTELSACDADAEGRGEQDFTLHLDEGVPVRITMRSTAVDALLVLEGPGGLARRMDDTFAGSFDASLVITPRATGDYLLRATTANPGQFGAYALRVDRIDEPVAAPLTLGARAEGRVAVAPPDGVPGTWFRFDAVGGSRVRIRVTSSELDTAAVVFAPGGEVWANDDANEPGPNGTERPTDSTLVVSAPITGTYLLAVTSYRHEQTGAVHVQSTVTPPIVLQPSERVPARGWAGWDAHGRVLGLFAGITAYPSGPLYGCADDARLLADAMRARHIIDDADAIVVTDGQATRAAVLGGIAQFATRAGPDDVVVIFYSGHGDVHIAPPGSPELDGLDETLKLIDGELLDTDLAAAIDALHAGTIVLALDSCHSGGFRDDFVTRPGRIGLFSSDPDILSDTAEPRRAGGYLSWWLRRGVLGEADRRPADGWLTAGELVDFIYAGFVRDDALFNPPGDDEPMQRLVADRGSVRWAQTLWAYPRTPAFDLPPVPDLPLESAIPDAPPPAAGGRCATQ